MVGTVVEVNVEFEPTVELDKLTFNDAVTIVDDNNVTTGVVVVCNDEE